MSRYAVAAADRADEAVRDDTIDVLHGQPVADPYRWLEDSGSARTKDWEEHQAARFTAARRRWSARAAFADVLRDLGGYDRVSAPLVRGERRFFTRRRSGEDLAKLYVTDAAGSRVLLDPAAHDPDGPVALDAWSPSPDGRLIAYQVSTAGTELSTLRVMDVSTGHDVEDDIDRVRRSSIGWLPDGTGFYYVRRQALDDPYHRRVRFHRIGSPSADDPCVFGEDRSPQQFYAVAVSTCGRWLTVRASEGSAPRNDLWLADLTETADLAGTAGQPPRLHPVHEGLPARTDPVLAGDRLFLRTDLDAPTGRVMIVPATDPARHRWREYLPGRDDAVLDDFAVMPGAGVALATWLIDGAHTITAHDLATGAYTGSVDLPGHGSVSRVEVARPGGNAAFVEYTDYGTPPIVLRIDANGRTEPVGGTASPVGDALTQVVTVTAPDGARVPVFIVSKPGYPDRPRPALLTGYGGFGVPLVPAYSTEAMAWVAAGGVYAVAGIRGGGERGRTWHEAAVRRRRQTAFDDFDAVARYLVSAGWTAPGTLGISGSSNGGLLACVALTQHPEQYAGVAAAAPLADMLRYEGSGLGPSWRDEYGTVADPDDFAALAAYSPYHRVRDGVAYPPVLLAAFDGDSRVDPMHARKMAAALRYASAGGPVLYRMERGVGHGIRPLSSALDLTADVLAFLADATGLDAAESHPVP